MALNTLKLKEVLLDIKNPRFATRKNKNQNIGNFMITHSKSKYIADIVEDIIKNGLSPLDTLGVFREDGKYIALDGNRRILALKIIYENSDLNLNPKIKFILNSHKKMINNKRKKLTTGLKAYVFNNREAAKKWLERKHTNDFGGASHQDWPTLEKKIFQNNKLALLIADEAEAAGISYDDYAVKIKYTTWERFFTSEYSRNWLGVGYDSETKKYTILNSEKLYERLKAIVDAKITFNKVNKKSDKLKTIKLLDNKYFKTANFEKISSNVGKKNKKKKGIFIEVEDYITNDKVFNLIKEIEELNKRSKIENYSTLVSCSIRPLVEITTLEYLEKVLKKSKTWFNNKPLKEKIIEVMDNIDNMKGSNKTTMDYLKSNIEQNLLLWNANLHDVLLISNKRELLNSLKRVAVFLEEVWKNIKKKYEKI